MSVSSHNNERVWHPCDKLTCVWACVQREDSSSQCLEDPVTWLAAAPAQTLDGSIDTF